MNNPTPTVSCKYGAPMGRMDGHPAAFQDEKCYLQRIPINSGGYDRGGAYWGLGAPLYALGTPDGEWTYFRAHSREDAKAIAREEFPGVRFFR